MAQFQVGVAIAALTTVVLICPHLGNAAQAPNAAGPEKPAQPKPPGCLEMSLKFCNDLYAPDHQGHLELASPTMPITIRMGHTKNGIDEPYYFYSLAKLNHKDRLPQDLRRTLEQLGYFKKLTAMLNQKHPSKMSVVEALNQRKAERELGFIWNHALHDTVLRRIEQKHPGYLKLLDVPPTLQIEYRKFEEELNGEISVALWADDPAWKRVTERAEQAKKALIDTITELKLKDQTKEKWINRVRAIKLILPDQNRLLYGLVDRCASTTINASYDPLTNTITVCAGLFNAADPWSILSHELAHALTPSMDSYVHELETDFGKSLIDLDARTNATPQALSCADWRHWKKQYRSFIDNLKELAVPLESLSKCLQDNKDFPSPDRPYLEKFTKTSAASSIDSLARRDIFLRLIKPELFLPDGTKTPNPAYLTPTNLDAPYIRPDPHRFMVESVFVNEYRCSPESMAATDKLDQAILSTKAVAAEFYRALTPLAGRFSRDRWMIHEGYSKDITEKFADHLGLRSFARLLETIQTVGDRRNAFFSGSALFCDRPSLRKDFPEEAAVQKKYSTEPHSEQTDRFKEILTIPGLRAALQCTKDFSATECAP